MRNILNIIAFAVIMFFVQGCEKEVMQYEGLDNIYFYVQRGAEWIDPSLHAVHPDTPIEFINIVGDTSVIKLRVRATGKIKDYDRSFMIEVVKDSTSAIEGYDFDFTPLQTIKGGDYYVDTEITLYRTPEIAKEKKTIQFLLKSSADFDTNINIWSTLSGMYSPTNNVPFDALRHTINLSDFITKPSRWIGGVYDQPGDKEVGLWGVFTEKKYRLICQKFDLTYSDFMSAETMPSAKQQVIKDVMSKYLQEQYDAGTPILEDDGRLMYFMGVSWTSIVGVPWIPESNLFMRFHNL